MTWIEFIYIFKVNVFPSLQNPLLPLPHLVLRLSHNKSKIPPNTSSLVTKRRERENKIGKIGMSEGKKFILIQGTTWKQQ